MCLGPEASGGFEVRMLPRRSPARDEIEIAVEAASVNPIDVRRAEGYGRRLLSLLGASRSPLILGNDLAGTVVAVGVGRASAFAVGDRVYGLKPASREGSHASHVVSKAAHVRKAPANRDIQKLAALPYCFVTMWLAASAAGITRENAEGKKVLVHGAAGGLGTLALQMLSSWGAHVIAIAKSSDLPACLAAGAAQAVDRTRDPFANLRGAFDATLNFATWDDELKLLSCLRVGALGHATTVHPLMQNFDEKGWVGGALAVILQKREARAALPRGALNYAWVQFRPQTEALSEMARLVELGRLSLPVGMKAPLREAREAFEHVRCRASGRVLLIP
jgi:NADPH:quinone reductase-like Zn-dependent oxidoreductase